MFYTGISMGNYCGIISGIALKLSHLCALQMMFLLRHENESHFRYHKTARCCSNWRSLPNCAEGEYISTCILLTCMGASGLVDRALVQKPEGRFQLLVMFRSVGQTSHSILPLSTQQCTWWNKKGTL